MGNPAGQEEQTRINSFSFNFVAALSALQLARTSVHGIIVGWSSRVGHSS